MKPRQRPTNSHTPLPAPPIEALAPTLSTASKAATSPRNTQLWLALCFPQLPLNSLSLTTEQLSSQAHAVYSQQNGKQLILCNNKLAHEAGIHPGMPLAQAQSLQPQLCSHPQQTAREQKLLNKLADQALDYSSQVQLNGCQTSPSTALQHHGILIEIGRSLRLFGGLDKLTQRIHEQYRPHLTQHAIAPTRQAAWQLAHWQSGSQVLEKHQLPSRLAQLPLRQLPLSKRQQHALQQMGLERLEQLLRLPRAGLQQRFGRPLLQQLEQLLGEQTSTDRPAHQRQAQFNSSLELATETHQQALIEQAIQRLLQQLEQQLRRHDASIQQLQLRLIHPQPPHTQIPIGSRQGLRQARDIQALIQQQLERLELQQNVRAVGLHSDVFTPYRAITNDLFDNPNPQGESIDQLIDRLRARLGHASIHGLCQHPDHRPENAWRRCDPGDRRELPARADLIRPLWLLPSWRPIQLHHYRLLSGPERLETGWWDTKDISRDYWIARHHNNRSDHWLYQDRRNGHWQLHGLFG